MSANATTAAPTGRKKLAQGNKVAAASRRSSAQAQSRDGSATLANPPPNTSSPEGAKEVSALPKGWRVEKLENLTVKIGSGSTPRGGEAVYRSSGVPLIRSMNVHFSGFKPDGLVYLDAVEAEKLEQVTVQKDDVLLNITGASIGRVTTAPDSLAGARVNQHVCIIRPKEGLAAKFLAQFLASPDEQARVMNVQVGATRQALTKAMVQNWNVPVPPLPEQRRIVAEIEKQFTRLEAGVAALRRVQANLKRYRAAVLKAACEGQLVRTEAEIVAAASRRRGKDKQKSGSGVPPLSEEAQSRDGSATLPATFETGAELLTRILAERRKNWMVAAASRRSGKGKQKSGSGVPPLGEEAQSRDGSATLSPTFKYKEPAAPDTANLPPLPEGWTWASLEQLAVSSSYGTSAKCSYENEGPPVLRIPNISSGRIDLADLKFAGASETIANGEELRPGDLIIIRTNGSKSLIGRSAVVREKLARPTDYASYLIRFRLVQEPVLFGWIGAIWDSSFLRTWIEQRAATSAGQHNISMSVLATLPIPLPPLAEQTRIVAEVERRLSVVEELESVVSANLQRAVRLRQSILQKAFTGQL